MEGSAIKVTVGAGVTTQDPLEVRVKTLESTETSEPFEDLTKYSYAVS